MKTLAQYFKTFSLAYGSHSSPEQNGKACFMNAISYLIGETYVSDHPENVCPLIRDLLISLNDVLPSASRDKLLPFLERAINSKTSNKEELIRRENLLDEFTEFCKSIYEKKHKTAYPFTNSGAAGTFRMAYNSVGSEAESQIVEAAMELLDVYLPPAKPLKKLDPCILVRAEKLEATYRKHYPTKLGAPLPPTPPATPASD